MCKRSQHRVKMCLFHMFFNFWKIVNQYLSHALAQWYINMSNLNSKCKAHFITFCWLNLFSHILLFSCIISNFFQWMPWYIGNINYHCDHSTQGHHFWLLSLAIIWKHEYFFNVKTSIKKLMSHDALPRSSRGVNTHF